MGSPKQNRPKRRIFTLADDMLILKQSRGEMTLHELQCQAHASVETLACRASDLGVELQRRLPRDPGSYHRHQKARPDEVVPEKVYYGDSGSNPVNVGNDDLLKALHEQHGERRYEALTIKSKEELA